VCSKSRLKRLCEWILRRPVAERRGAIGLYQPSHSKSWHVFFACPMSSFEHARNRNWLTQSQGIMVLLIVLHVTVFQSSTRSLCRDELPDTLQHWFPRFSTGRITLKSLLSPGRYRSGSRDSLFENARRHTSGQMIWSGRSRAAYRLGQCSH
jgi:hypothetical protein